MSFEAWKNKVLELVAEQRINNALDGYCLETAYECGLTPEEVADDFNIE